MKRWNYASMALVLWSGLSILLPAARAVGLIHLSWWICAAPFGLLFLLGAVVVVFAGLLNHAIDEERDVPSSSRFAGGDGTSDNELATTATIPPTVRPTFLTWRFISKQ